MEREEPPDLDVIQRRLSRLVTEPNGVEAALAAEGDADGTCLRALVREDRALPAPDRVAVYANAYFARLHDCLRDDFGALARALGADAFHDLAKTYLMVHPPTRPSLRHAGAHLARHLATEPFAEIFARRCPYAADLARLEWALVDAFDAADAPVLTREDLAAVPPDAWPELCFAVSASLHLLSCAWPIQRVRERFDSEDAESVWPAAPAIEAERTHLRVFRQGERVRYRAISALESEALEAASEGQTFAAICECVAEQVDADDAAARSAGLIASWVADGLLVRSP